MRKAIADAEITELKLQHLRSEVVPVEAYQREMRRVLDRIHVRISSMPGEYAPRILNIPDVPTAVARLREIAHHQLEQLRRAGHGPDDQDSDAEEEEELRDVVVMSGITP